MRSSEEQGEVQSETQGFRRSRVRRILHPVKWKYAAGELLLIVAGVLIALAIDNWNQERRDRETELQVLRQIRSELQADLAAVENRINTQHTNRGSALLVREHLDKGLPYDTTLDIHFGRIAVLTGVTPNSGGYETLKSQGLTIISNDSLRIGITQLYEADYGWGREFYNAVSRDLGGGWQEVIHHRFVQDDISGPAKPRDYELLHNDAEFKAWLNMYIQRFSWTIRFDERLMESIQSLLVDIDSELAGD